MFSKIYILKFNISAIPILLFVTVFIFSKYPFTFLSFPNF